MVQSPHSPAQSYERAEQQVTGFLDNLSVFLQSDNGPEAEPNLYSNLVPFPAAPSNSSTPTPTQTPQPPSPPPLPPPVKVWRALPPASLPSNPPADPQPTPSIAAEATPILVSSTPENAAPLEPSPEQELKHSISELLALLAPEDKRVTALNALKQLVVLLGDQAPAPDPQLIAELQQLRTEQEQVRSHLRQYQTQQEQTQAQLNQLQTDAARLSPLQAEQEQTRSQLERLEARLDKVMTLTVHHSQLLKQNQQGESVNIPPNVGQETQQTNPEASPPEPPPTATHPAMEPESKVAVAPDADVAEKTVATATTETASPTSGPEPTASCSDDALQDDQPQTPESQEPEFQQHEPQDSGTEASDPPQTAGTETLETPPSLNTVSTFPEPNAPDPPRFLSVVKMALLGLGVSTIVGITWGVYRVLLYPHQALETQLSQAFAADPELALYRLEAQVQRDGVALSGTLPNHQLRDRVRAVVVQQAPNRALNDQIIVVDAAVAQSVQQMSQTLNQTAGIAVEATFSAGIVALRGTAASRQEVERIARTFGQMPGVETVANQLRVQPLSIPTRIYFGQNSAQMQPMDAPRKIVPLAAYLKAHPHLQIQIVGYGHTSEANATAIAQTRAQAVQTALENHGVDRRRLQLSTSTHNPPGMAKGGERWLGRCVVFEVKGEG